MATVSKVTVSLTPELLRRVERLRLRTGESRSALVARALREALDDEHARKIDDYLRAYRESPETGDEVSTARRMARRSLRSLPT